jgi:signal peptidase II
MHWLRDRLHYVHKKERAVCMENKNCCRVFWSMLIVGLLLIVDQVSKYLAQLYLHDADIMISPFAKLTLAYNKGISWSLLTPTSLQGEYALIIGIMIILLIYLIHVKQEIQKGRSLFSEILIIGGALSNLVDRVTQGAVVDYILLYYGTWSFPVFNLADLFIFVGVMLFLKKGFCHESC